MNPVIVGWGHTRFGRLEGETLEDLIKSAAKEALGSAGVAARDIQGAWLGNFNSGLIADGFCSSMIISADDDLRFIPATRCENACASGSAALYSAIDAIRSGRIQLALVVGAEKMTALDTPGVTRALGGASYQAEEASMSFPDIFARFAHAYADRFGDPVKAMAQIAVKNHSNAMRNPLAHMHKELSLEFCLNVSDRNPMVSDPLKVSDCSLISDGAAAVVLASDEMIADFQRAVGFRATAHVNDFLPMSRKDLASFEGPKRAIEQAYAAAGVSVDDLSLVEVHDCFTIAELLMVEAIGIAKPGGGRTAVMDGVTARDGRLPFNLSGGLKAKGHPVGATGVSMHVMCAKQLVGEAGDLQHDDATLAMCVNLGGGAVASYASILEPLKA